MDIVNVAVKMFNGKIVDTIEPKSEFQLAWELKKRQQDWKKKMSGHLTSRPFACLAGK